MFLGECLDFGDIRKRFDGAGNRCNPGAICGHAGSDLVAHRGDGFGRWADPDHPGVHDGLCEPRILCKESVAWVDRIGARLAGDFEDARDVEIRLRRGRRADIPRLIGEVDMERVAIEFRVDGDRMEVKISCCADHAHGDLATIRDQNGFHSEHPRNVDSRRVVRLSSDSRSARRVTNGTGIAVCSVA